MSELEFCHRGFPFTLPFFSKAGELAGWSPSQEKKSNPKKHTQQLPPVPRHQVSPTLSLELWKVKLMPKAVVAKFIPSA